MSVSRKVESSTIQVTEQSYKEREKRLKAYYVRAYARKYSILTKTTSLVRDRYQDRVCALLEAILHTATVTHIDEKSFCEKIIIYKYR